MKSLSLEGIRCFGERVDLPIAPVTLLVGENSTGKSTVLAMVRAAWDLAYLSAARTEPDFSEAPFDLGGYDAMAYFHGGQAKRAHKFSIGWVLEARERRSREDSSVQGTFVESAGQAVLQTWSQTEGTRRIEFERLDGQRVKARLLEDEKKLFEDEAELPPGLPLVTSGLFFRPLRAAIPNSRTDFRDAFVDLPRHPDAPRPLAIAPIRSAPRRTYDPRRDLREPEGSHVPMLLATLHATNKERFASLVKGLATYGREAGLFSDLKIKRLGKKPGDPFQVLVTVDKHPFNLSDVGYGVSQVLPVLVDTLLAPHGQIFLWQQPEVHLHPRAQAALGTLLVQQAANQKQTFVVETHSDHLVDRVRMDVRKGGALRPEDVRVLYFERVAGRAKVHALGVDARGNLTSVPTGYRRFFLDEERRLLGLDEAG